MKTLATRQYSKEMAEGGVEERAIAYQTVTEKMCEICLEEDSFKQATWYCKQCSQRLCDKCWKYHRKVSATKDHGMVRVDEMRSNLTQQQGEVSDEVRTPMCTTHNQPLEFYCGEHNVPVCKSCKLVDHRKCENLQDLEHVATENKGRNLDVLQHLKTVESGMQEIKDALGKEKDTMKSQKDLTIQKIKNKIEELEILGQKKISEVEAIFKQKSESLDREMDVNEHSKVLVSKSIEELERATKGGSSEEIFLATSQAEKEAGKYQDILNESSNLTHREIDFEVDSQLKDIKSFGKITVMESAVTVDYQLQVIDYLNIECHMHTLWFDVLPDRQLVLLNIKREENQLEMAHLCLYSSSNRLLSQLDLPLTISADSLNDHQIIVANLSNSYLQTVNIVNNQLMLGDVIETDVCPQLILKYSNSSVLIAATSDTGGCFQILDLSGHVHTHINVDLESPLFMRMSNDRKAIYIVDSGKGCQGFNLKGDKIFHYTHQNYVNYWGLAVDGQNSIYLAAGTTKQALDCLIKLSPAGVFLKQIDIRLKSPIRFERNKLYIVEHSKELIVSYVYV